VATTAHHCTHPLLLHLCLPGLLVPDLPLEETDAIRAACEKAGLELVLLTTPTTPQSRMADIARASQGFVYLVSVTGKAAAAAIQPGRSGRAYAGTPGSGAVVGTDRTLCGMKHESKAAARNLQASAWAPRSCTTCPASTCTMMYACCAVQV
jgi:hypothetical protein